MRVFSQDVADAGWRAAELVASLATHRHPERNPLRRLALYDANVLLVVRALNQEQDMRQAALSSVLLETPNASLPWTADEDVALVNEAADGEPVHVIANALGRTPAAVATRLSTLTGIPRSDIVDAYLDGELDHGEAVRGLFHGRLVPFRDAPP